MRRLGVGSGRAAGRRAPSCGAHLPDRADRNVTRIPTGVVMDTCGFDRSIYQRVTMSSVNGASAAISWLQVQ